MERQLDFRITIGGAELDQSINREILSLTCDRNTLMSSEMTLVLNDPDYILANGDFFQLGKRIELFLTNSNNEYSVMLGKIVSREPHYSVNNTPTLLIRAYDLSFLMRKKHAFQASFH